jgi:hypothetical protein
MTVDGFLKLAWQSVTDPRDVARLLLSIRPGPEALWTAFALVVVLNALVFSSTQLLVPPQGPMPFMFGSPVGFIVTQAATLAGMIAAMTWTGRLLGGQGGMADVGILLIWMQGLRVLVQLILLVLMPLSGLLSGLVMMAASGAGLWILLNFIDEAHELGSLGRAAVVLVLGLLGLGFGLTLLLSLSGFNPEGMMTNV